MSCPVPFLPPYAVCIQSNVEETLTKWQNYKLLLLIPFTLIICINIRFDFVDIPLGTPSDFPLKTSYITILSISILLLSEAMFIKYLVHYGIGVCCIPLIIFLIKGPLTVIWTNHRLKKSSLKRNQQKMNEGEESHAQLENYPLNEL